VNLVNTTTPASNRPTLRREPLLHLTILVEEGLDGTIDSELIDTHELTVARGLRESPTVLIDGRQSLRRRVLASRGWLGTV
jgi:hypothetical protein